MQRTSIAITLACLGALAFAPGAPRAQSFDDDLVVLSEVEDLSLEDLDEVPLLLEVWVNGRELNLVAEFQAHSAPERLSTSRAELAELGIRAPTGASAQIFLDTIPGLRYRYDEVTQSIQFLAPHSALLPDVQSAIARPEREEPERTWGGVVNYSVSTDFGGGSGDPMDYRGLNASFEGLIFSPHATLGSTAFYRKRAEEEGSLIRQETALQFTNETRALAFTVGDFVSSSLSWTRPVRMGGFQLRRDFSLRSDLVTEQYLSYSGAAAVPSTVDIYIENNRAYSTTVRPGPYRIEDIPFYTGSGDAVVVIREQDGDVHAREVSFFAAENLLKKGVADYSIEVGRAREGYGTLSNRYGEDIIASASLRYGLTEHVTVQSHVEAKSDLMLYGAGLSIVPFDLGELSVAAGASRYRGESAGFVQGSFRTSVRSVDVNMSAMRSEAGFADLAFATGVDYLGGDAIADADSLLEFPTSLEVLSLSIPVTRDKRKMGISLVHSNRASSEDLIAGVSFGSSIPGSRASVSMFASHNFITEESRMAVNLSMPLDNRRHLSGGVSRGGGETATSVALSRPIGERVGDHGYHIQAENRGGESTFASARGSYRGRYGMIGGEAVRSGTNTNLRAQVDGAIVMAGGAVAAGNRVNDSFAIVDVGVPDVPVYNQNRVVTHSGATGTALVTGLSSYRRNRISVNVDDLPPDATLNATAMDVIPARHSGVRVDLGGSQAPAILVVLRDASGRVLPAGSVGHMNGVAEEFYVGYDGQAWLEGLQGINTILVQTPTGSCRATLDAAYIAAAAGAILDPLECL